MLGETRWDRQLEATKPTVTKDRNSRSARFPLAGKSPNAGLRDGIGRQAANCSRTPIKSVSHTTTATGDSDYARMPLSFVHPLGHMTPSASVNAFEEFVENRGGALAALTVRTGVAEMLSFYESVSPTDCANENGGMLLFQWGTYNWGDGPQFEIDITRQFIESAAEGDDAISQLQLNFKFPPDKDTAALGDGNRWCNSQSETRQLREFIFSNRAFLTKADWDPPGVSVHHEYV